MRIYLKGGDVVAASADFEIVTDQGEHTLWSMGVPDGEVIRYWHPQEEKWYDCRWDLETDSPNYGQLYYEGLERGDESVL